VIAYRRKGRTPKAPKQPKAPSVADA
jgi:hypothetical protein